VNLESHPHHQRKNIRVTVKVEPDVPIIHADHDKLTQAVANIVDNAFNYTHADGRIDIHVQLQPDEKQVLMTVKDTGIGIPEHFREAIWRRFERVEEDALVMDVAGTGLGLPIVKELVNMHHGEVWFESELGQGTTFFIKLPLDQPASAIRATDTAEVVRAKLSAVYGADTTQE
jgi:signal transduction histidine kinase